MPWYPKADKQPSSNYWQGNSGRLAAVLHIAQGGYQSSIDYMAGAGVSSHFIIARDGRCSQMVDTDDSAWGNGAAYIETQAQAIKAGFVWKGPGWYCPHDHLITPRWGVMQTNHSNANRTTISIEHEGYTGQALTEAMIATQTDLLQWLAQVHPTLFPYVPNETLVAHGAIDPTDKAFCPGTAFDFSAIAARANAVLTWQQRWAAKGIALPAAQEGWAIPQCYKTNAATLGACLVAERWAVPDVRSIAEFEHGIIVYVKATNTAKLVLDAA